MYCCIQATESPPPCGVNDEANRITLSSHMESLNHTNTGICSHSPTTAEVIERRHFVLLTRLRFSLARSRLLLGYQPLLCAFAGGVYAQLRTAAWKAKSLL